MNSFSFNFYIYYNYYYLQNNTYFMLPPPPPHLTEYLGHLSILTQVDPLYFFKWLLDPQAPYCIENGPFSPLVGIWVVSNFLLLYQYYNGYS